VTEAGAPAGERGAAIETRGLAFGYRPGELVIDGLSIRIPKRGSFAILGQNGCGKTTLLKLFLGLCRPVAGSLCSDGEMALVPQLFQATFAFNVLEMVLMGRARKIGLFSQPGRRDRAMALEALGHFGIADLAYRSFHELSGGQRQMAMLARALVSEAEILVLDEPTSALDLRNQDLILAWISRLAHVDKLAVVFTTHLPQHALLAADAALFMFSDGVYATGSTQEIMTEDNLSRLYGLPIRRLAFRHEGLPTETLAPVFLDGGRRS
jgi:iron complex transport system ATP-binding protein